MSKSQVFVCYSGSYFVARHNADLNLRVTESECVIRLAAFMRNTGIPWAFTYGNHDTESLASANKQELNEVYKSLSFKTSGNLLYPYTQPDVMGRNNQLIEIRNSDGTLNTVLFMIDSNAYTGEGINVYDYIHDDQVDWYADEVSRMNSSSTGIQFFAKTSIMLLASFARSTSVILSFLLNLSLMKYLGYL